MSDLRSGSVEDVAFVVCSAMSAAGVTVVLSGGGAATVYAPRAYQTRDLDFVLLFGVKPPSAQPLFQIGFAATESTGIYRHPQSPFTLEFLDGPLAVGADVITKWDTLEKDDLLLHIITPTDCVRDRLAAGIHWHDPNAARQAAEIAKLHPIDMTLIEEWCKREGSSRTYTLFRRFLETPG